MSTKFSVRPAPRKRPWLCTRSPPCLIPPPFPLSLICTWYLRRMYPAPPQLPNQGTLLLLWQPGPRTYHGIWGAPARSYDCTFKIDQTTGWCSAGATWSLFGGVDGGTYHGNHAKTHPHMFYNSSLVYAGFASWQAEITITG